MNDLQNEIQRLGQINQELTLNVDAKHRNIAETNDQFRQTLNQRLAEVLNVVQLGYDKIYKVTNPFDFMELISLEGKTNFFERKVGEYALANVKKTESDFAFTDDF